MSHELLERAGHRIVCTSIEVPVNSLSDNSLSMECPHVRSRFCKREKIKMV